MAVHQRRNNAAVDDPGKSAVLGRYRDVRLKSVRYPFALER